MLRRCSAIIICAFFILFGCRFTPGSSGTSDLSHTDEGAINFLEKLITSDGSQSDEFGKVASISADGSVVLFGVAYDDDNGEDSGSVYFYRKDGDHWVQGEKLSAADGTAHAWFGNSSALSADGSISVIGANGVDDRKGVAYVLVRNGTVWTQSACFSANDSVVEDYFGISASLSANGETVLIGAPGNGNGAAYIFTWNGSTWSQQAKITAYDGAVDDGFGSHLCLSADGTTAAVAASQDDNNGSSSGSVYIFTRSGESWNYQAALTAGDAAEYDYFGSCVDLSADGSSLLVGAYGDEGKTGAVYLFARNGSVWTEVEKLTASDAAAYDHFGQSAALSDDGMIILVGAYGHDSYGYWCGSAYLFANDGSTWGEGEKIMAEDGAAQDAFGYNVLLSSDGRTAVIGAKGDDDNASGSGAAYMYSITISPSL